VRTHTSALFRIALPLVVALPGLVSAQWPRGGWLEQDWTYLYEARFDDGAPDGLGIVGVAGEFSSLDGGWDYLNPAAAWLGDLIDDDGIPGGAELLVGDGDGDNESGIQAVDAEALGILDPAGLPVSNSRIYFERFLTDDIAGAGQPVIDFDDGVTIIARFRFFSLDRMKADAELQTRLGLGAMDVAALGTGEVVDASEYDESPRESFFDQKGMFMVTRRDVYQEQAGIPGVGGIYFGVANDGDDSWDPSNQVEPASPGPPVDVRIAYILGGPESQNFAFQGSADSRLIAGLRARGAQVTILDDTGPQGHQFYESTDPAYAGAPGPDAVAHDFDVVLISSTVGSAGVATDNDNDGVVDDPDLGYRFRGVPYVCWENGLVRKGYAWMADPANPQQGGFVIGTPPTGTRQRIDIVDNTHPITEGFDLGEVDVFHSPQRMSATTDPFFGTVAPGVRVLARNPADNFSALALLCVADPESGNLGDGDVASARQVYFFFEDESAVAMNATGQLLFDRAVEWALGDAKAALLGPSPPPPEPPAETIPSFYINLGATPAIEAAGLPFTTRVLRGAFVRDTLSADATVPTLGGDTRVWAPLPAGTTEDFVSVYITIAPEAGAGGGGQAAAPPRMRVKVYFDGSTDPAIEIQDHHLDPDILPAIASTEDGSGPNDGTGLGMGLWRNRTGGCLEVDYFGVLDGAVDPSTVAGGLQRPGDENQDGELNLSDPISVLNHLFAGTNPTLPCGDGTVGDPANQALLDLNGDDSINLSDPIYGLNFLFSGSASPVNCTDVSCPCIPIVGCPDDPSGNCSP
jgi:hypothetical protein